MRKISLNEFAALCKMGQRYEGEVEDLGYVYWVPKNVMLPMSGFPPYNTAHDTRFAVDLYELVVVKDEKNSDTGINALQSVREIGIDVLSLYGIAKSVESLALLHPRIIQELPDQYMILQEDLSMNRNNITSNKAKDEN
jgi:hypothetical protein